MDFDNAFGPSLQGAMFIERQSPVNDEVVVLVDPGEVTARLTWSRPARRLSASYRGHRPLRRGSSATHPEPDHRVAAAHLAFVQHPHRPHGRRLGQLRARPARALRPWIRIRRDRSLPGSRPEAQGWLRSAARRGSARTGADRPDRDRGPTAHGRWHQPMALVPVLGSLGRAIAGCWARAGPPLLSHEGPKPRTVAPRTLLMGEIAPSVIACPQCSHAARRRSQGLGDGFADERGASL